MRSSFGGAARKVALEQAISQLREDNNQSHSSTKKSLLNHLNGLLAFNREQDVEVKNEEKAIDAFRQFLREQIIEKENQENHALCDRAFQLQLMLARHWPVNNRDAATHQPLDPISLEPITHINEAVPLSSGHLISKDSLTRFYAERNAYVYQDLRLYARHLITPGVFLSQRELDSLCGHGISLAPHPHAPTNATSNRFIAFMLLLGEEIGRFVGYGLLMIFVTLLKLVPTVIAFSPIAGLLGSIFIATMLASGIIAGAIAAHRAAPGEKFKNFLYGFSGGLLASIIFLSLSTACYGLVVGMGIVLEVSTATISSLSSILPALLPLFLVLPICYATAKEFIHPGFLNQFFDRICSTWATIIVKAPIIAFGVIFAETACLLSRAADALYRALNVERFQRPRQNSGPQAVGYSEPQVRNELSANAQIHHGLGVERAASPSLNVNEDWVNAHSNANPVANLAPSIPPLAQSRISEEEEASLRQIPSLC